tara:strand:+ start:3924 stop:4166 length:243 start_codon:yes stop_codon:yes gene_type:complete
MDFFVIFGYILLLWLTCIIGILFASMVMGCVALIINERRTICCCFYLCEKKKNIEINSVESRDVIIIIEPNGDKKLGIKN